MRGKGVCRKETMISCHQHVVGINADHSNNIKEVTVCMRDRVGELLMISKFPWRTSRTSVCSISFVSSLKTEWWALGIRIEVAGQWTACSFRHETSFPSDATSWQCWSACDGVVLWYRSGLSIVMSIVRQGHEDSSLGMHCALHWSL